MIGEILRRHRNNLSSCRVDQYFLSHTRTAIATDSEMFTPSENIQVGFSHGDGESIGVCGSNDEIKQQLLFTSEDVLDRTHSHIA